MLRRVVVSNYKSLGENVELRLGGLTVLVGPNGSGKSSVADVVQFVADCLRHGLDLAVTRRGGMRGIGRWSGGRPFNVSIRLEIEESEARGSYELRLRSHARGEEYRVDFESATWVAGGESHQFEVAHGRWSGPAGLTPSVDETGLALPLVAADQRFKRLADRLRGAAVYSIYPDVLRKPQRPDATQPMEEHGQNWTTTMRSVLRSPLARDLKVALHHVAGDILDVDIAGSGGYLVARFRHEKPATTKNAKWLPALQESDGTLRIAGILTALLQSPAPLLIGIEEPELTIHPGMLPLLYDYLREASERSQVLVTTHSPDLLALVDAESIYVVERKEGVTTVGQMAEAQRAAVHKRLTSPGELMRIEGLQQDVSPSAIPPESSASLF